MPVDFHQYGEFKIPVCTGKSARSLYNMRPDEIDDLRCGTIGVFEPGGFRGTPFNDRFVRLSDQEIKERIEFLKRTRSSIIHLMHDNKVPVKDQNGHGYCWSYGAISTVEANYLAQGRDYIELSPHSVAAGYMKGKDRGGWASMALKWSTERGIVPDALWPKHSLNHRLWDDPAIAAEAAKHKPLEWVDIEDGDMEAERSLLASNFACGMGIPWWGHLIMFGIIDWSDKYGWLYGERNSHGRNFGYDGWAFHTEASAKHMGGSTVFVADRKLLARRMDGPPLVLAA